MDQSRERAIGFAAAHYSGFVRNRLEEIDVRAFGGSAYEFEWRQVVNRHQVLAPHLVAVRVDRVTGEAWDYAGWHPRLTGPTVPRVRRETALRIASHIAPWDTREVPFTLVRLTLWPDEIGVQRLEWDIWQRKYNAAGQEEAVWTCGIDAITGRVTGTARSLGGPPDRDPAPGARVRRRPPAAAWLRGNPLDLSHGMLLRNGRSYVPVGLAQLFGWQLQQKPAAATALLLRDGRKSVRVAARTKGTTGGGRTSALMHRGNLFVASRWLARLAGIPVRWEKAAGRVHFDAPRHPSPPAPPPPPPPRTPGLPPFRRPP